MVIGRGHLDLPADPDTLAALDAFGLVPDHDGVGRVDGKDLVTAFIGRCLDPVVIAEALQGAKAGLLAGQAVHGMVADQEVQEFLSDLTDLGRIGMDHHAVPGHGGTRGFQLGVTFDLHQTKTAAREVCDFLQVTKIGDVDAGFFGCLQKIDGSFQFKGATVNCQMYHALPPTRLLHRPHSCRPLPGRSYVPVPYFSG